jgi:transcriptional regulator with XRE-family HTH domain
VASYRLGVRDIENQLLDEIFRVMRRRGLTQKDFAAAKGKTPQAVNPYFRGHKSLLTDTGKDLLEFLGVRIRLELIEEAKNGEGQS